MATAREPATIKGYQLRAKMAEGGSGAIYRAEQPLLRRAVAIKVIQPKFASQPEFIRRFEAEAQIIARLEHPAIVPLYDYWRDPSGAYLVMRWMPGGSLAGALQSGPPPLPAVARIFEQIAAALAFAHDHGVVHRDLKPGNILLDAESNAYLADFGIAKDLTRGADSPQAELPAFTPGYAAPEQLALQPTTPQSDIYSLGTVLYELLAGAPAFAAATPDRVMSRQMHGVLPRLGEHRPDLPGAFDAVIRRALAHDPAERYPSVQSMAQTVSDLLAPLTPDAARRFGAPTPPDPAQAGARPTLAFDLDDRPNPYKGLRAFGEADADDFFGRDALTRQLLERLAAPGPSSRFLAVVGPSGSGKSSVVRAGLIPALRRGLIPGSDRWFVVDMIPGPDPLRELEAALLRVAADPPPGLTEQLRADPAALGSVVERLLPRDPRVELVLVIDQFEELFTLVADERLRVRLLEGLLAAARDPRTRLRVIATLRADFYDRPLMYPAFGELLHAGAEVVLPLTPAELEQAIVNPARRAGATADPRLVAAIIRDVGDQPGRLPLVQYALTELFERGRGLGLTLAAYQRAGGVLGMLARRADALYDGLDAAGQAAARQMFLRLIAPGEGVEDTRRRVRRSELALDRALMARADAFAADDNTPTQPIGARAQSPERPPSRPAQIARSDAPQRSPLDEALRIYGDARLLTFDRDPLTREPTIEVAHEALIRSWRRLRRWLDAARDDLRVQRRLAESAAEWARARQDDSFLASGARLAQFVALAEAGEIALNADEQTYLARSVQRDQAGRAAEAQARREREALLEARALAERQRAEAQSAARRRLGRLAAFLAVALVVSLIASGAAGLFYVRAQRNADDARAQLELADSQRLAVLAGNLPERESETALLLALEAASRNPNPVAERALREAYARMEWQPTILLGHTGKVYSAMFSPDGQRIVSASADGTARLWDAQGHALATLTGHTSEVNLAVFSPDGARIATASADHTARLWDAQGRPLATLTGHAGSVTRVAWSRDGRRIVTVGADQTARVWDRAGAAVATLQGHAGEIFNALWSPDGSRIVTAGADGTARVWDADGRPVATLRGHAGAVYGVAWSPDGRQIVTSSADKTVRLWDAAGHELRTLKSGVSYYGVVWSPDGAHLALMQSDNTATVIDLSSHTLTSALHNGLIVSAAFSPDGLRLVTASLDGSAQVSKIGDSFGIPAALFSSLGGHTGAVERAVFSPDGQSILTASDDQTIRLWREVARPLIDDPDYRSASPYSIITSSHQQRIFTYAQYSKQKYAARLWDARGRLIATLWQDAENNITSAHFSPDEQRLIVGLYDGEFQIWSADGKRIASILGDPNALGLGMFSPDGRHILTTSRSGGRSWLRDALGAPIARLDAAGTVTDAAFSPEGAHIALAFDDGTARVWDMAGRLAVTLTGHTAKVNSVAFSPDGRYLVTASADQTAMVWDLSGHALATLRGHTGAVLDAAFSTDGQQVVTASLDQTARLWDRAGNARATLAHTNAAAPAFSPDGKYIVAVDAHGAVSNVRLYDANGKELALLAGPFRPQPDASFSKDGREIVVDDGVIRWRYPLGLDDLLKAAGCRVGRGLSSDEIERFQVRLPLRFDFAARRCSS